MTSPFDYVNSINSGKHNMMRDTENDALSEKDYSGYMVNKALSYFPDTLLHANLMNQYHQLDNRPQYEFLLNSIRPKKRFAKWVKDTGDKDLDVVCEYYQCNRNIGKDYLTLFSSDQLLIMKEQLETGGIKNEPSRKTR
jgi:hypothetical protein|tara:strand:+ start:278 stop:694 length:417 start_codon:yes stop_codon:yes gene_type:complete